MAKVELLHTLQTTEFELSTLGKTLAKIDFPNVFAKKCQFILENTVFIKALAEIKTSLKEFMKSKTIVTDGPGIKKYQLRTRKERKYIELHESSLDVNLTEELSDLKNKGSKKITGTSLICTQCQQEGCACNQSMKLSTSHDHEQNTRTIKTTKDLISETKSSALSVQDEDQQINQSVEDTTKKGHSKGENNDQFSCSQCNKILKTSIRLKRHLKIHINSEAFVCNTCQRAFRTASSLASHPKSHGYTKPYECKYCGQTFKSKNYRDNHETMKHGGISKYRCGSCGKNYADGYSLKIHCRTHTNEKPHSCQQCHKCFHSLPQLHQHEKIHLVPYLCTTCGKRFATKLEVQTHGYTHTGERPFNCGKCEKSFRSKQARNVHIRTIHIDEKKWKCQECTFETKFLSHLRLHQKRSHNSGPISCEKCGLEFTSYNKLTLHKYEHRPNGNPYTCKQCQKGFVNKKVFDAHVRTHTNERPYKCSFCSNSFKTAYTRSSHELIHKGLKPHVCDLCGKSFTQRSTMKKHQKNVHGDKKLPDHDQISNNVPMEANSQSRDLVVIQQNEVACNLESNGKTDETTAVQEYHTVSVSEPRQPYDSCSTECNLQSDNTIHGQPLQAISSDATNNQFSYTNDLGHHTDTILSYSPQNININKSVMGQLMNEDVTVPRTRFLHHEHPLLTSIMSAPEISTTSFTQLKSADIINTDNSALQIMVPDKDVRHKEIISLEHHQDIRHTHITSLNTSIESSANNTGDLTLRDLMQ